MKRIALLTAVCIFSLFPFLYAEETLPPATSTMGMTPTEKQLGKYTPEPPSKLELYWKGVSSKIDFGASNLIVGWTEAIGQPVEKWNQQASALKKTGDSFLAFGKGLVEGAIDMVGGALNLVTAPFPQFQIPLPEGGADVAHLIQATPHYQLKEDTQEPLTQESEDVQKGFSQDNAKSSVAVDTTH